MDSLLKIQNVKSKKPNQNKQILQKLINRSDEMYATYKDFKNKLEKKENDNNNCYDNSNNKIEKNKIYSSKMDCNNNNNDNIEDYDAAMNDTYLSYDEVRLFNFISELQADEKHGISQEHIETLIDGILTTFHHDKESKKHILKVVKYIDDKTFGIQKKIKILQLDIKSLNKKLNSNKSN